MTDVHASAVVDSSAQVAETVTIGPYCIVGPNVVLSMVIQQLVQIRWFNLLPVLEQHHSILGLKANPRLWLSVQITPSESM